MNQVSVRSGNFCYITNRRKNFYDKIVQKHSFYGHLNGVDYITTGTVVNGKMLVWTNTGNGWDFQDMPIDKRGTIAYMINQKFRKIVNSKSMSRNAARNNEIDYLFHKEPKLYIVDGEAVCVTETKEVFISEKRNAYTPHENELKSATRKLEVNSAKQFEGTRNYAYLKGHNERRQGL